MLQPTTSAIRHERYLPSDALSPLIEHYWVVEWDLRGRPSHVARTLPHPSIHLTFERETSQIVGVVTGAFTRVLEGQGRVFGVKFHPGAFLPFANGAVSAFTDVERPGSSVFGEAIEALERDIAANPDDEPRIALAESFLLARLPPRDETVERARKLVELIRDNRVIMKVEDIVERTGFGVRSLQRLFSRAVGVSPKWVIQRYRLHEAAEQIASGAIDDWAGLAVDLGYFDQAHFIRDFRMIIGQTPVEYAATVTSRAR